MRGMIAGAQGGAGALGLLGGWESLRSVLLGCLSRLFLFWVVVALPRELISYLSVACGLMRTESNRDA